MTAVMYRSAGVIILLAFSLNNHGVTAIITHSPESVVAYLRDNASFSCITDGSNLLVWTVNGVEARFPVVRNRGITYVYSGVNAEASNLTVSASLQNNNSEIICIQQNVVTGQEIARTTPVYLYVQGLLDPPSNITVDFRNQTVIHLIWLPPFSMKDISGYVVTVSAESSNEISDKVQTLLSEFTFTWRPGHGYCSRFIFQVAAVNTLGTSNKTNRIVAGFLRSIVEVSPSNKTARAGQWVNFTCGVQCSRMDLIGWFLNSSSLSLFQDTGLNFKQYPRHSYCSTSQIISKENHTLSLMTSYNLGFPLEVYCAVISGCEERARHQCTSYTCSSESAWFELQGDKIMLTTQEIHSHNTSTSVDMQDTPHHAVRKDSYNILFGTSLGLGAMLLILLTLFVMTLVILMCYCHRNKKREPKIQEVIYDTPAVIIQPTTLNELEMEKYESMASAPALQHCPAYETASCIK